MSLDNFEFTDTKEFRVASGKLLIADPYYLGYPHEKLVDKWNALQKAVHERREIRTDTRPDILMLSFGFIVDDYTDGLWNVYQNKNGLTIVASERDSVERRIFRGVYSISFEKKYRDKLEKAKEEHKREEFLFRAGVDLCTLLIGDAEKFIVPISERQIAPNEYIQIARRESYQKMVAESLEETNNQLVKVENGVYTASINRSKRRILI